MKEIGIKYENGKVIHCYEGALISKGLERRIMSFKNIDIELKNLTARQNMLDRIEKVIFNNPVTVVIWRDGTKTVVKCEGEAFDPEKGLAMAIVKKLLGYNNGYYYEVFKKWLPKDEPKAETIIYSDGDMKKEISL